MIPKYITFQLYLYILFLFFFTTTDRLTGKGGWVLEMVTLTIRQGKEKGASEKGTSKVILSEK